MTIRGANYPRKPNDFYSTPAETTQALLSAVRFNSRVCDPACGKNAILDVLKANGYVVCGNDLSKGYDFLTHRFLCPKHDIVTNPPFGIGGRIAAQFIARALEVTKPWRGKVAMLLPVDYDSGKTRLPLFGDCQAFALKLVLVNRIRWFNGQSGSINHAWFVWQHGYAGSARLRYTMQKYPKNDDLLK